MLAPQTKLPVFPTLVAYRLVPVASRPALRWTMSPSLIPVLRCLTTRSSRPRPCLFPRPAYVLPTVHTLHTCLPTLCSLQTPATPPKASSAAPPRPPRVHPVACFPRHISCLSAPFTSPAMTALSDQTTSFPLESRRSEMPLCTASSCSSSNHCRAAHCSPFSTSPCVCLQDTAWRRLPTCCM